MNNISTGDRPVAPTSAASEKRINPPGPNGLGEIPGIGPAWACESFGRYGHNQMTCIDCLNNFTTQMNKREAA